MWIAYEKLLKNNPQSPYKIEGIEEVRRIIDETISSKRKTIKLGDLKNDEVLRLITVACSK